MSRGGSYDTLGQLTNIHYSASNTLDVSYSYEREGSALRIKIKGRHEQGGNYDTLGQLTNIHYSASNTLGVSFAYDRLGRQTTITDGQGTRSFTYNDALQLSSELVVAAVLGGTSNQINRVYDAYGRPAGFSFGRANPPDEPSYSVNYSYDPVGRFSSISNNVGGALRAATYSYLPGSDLISGLSHGPVQISRSYEPTRNLITQIKNSSGSTLISQYDYVNDAIGRRTSVGMTGEAFSDFGISHKKYSYIKRRRLKLRLFRHELATILGVQTCAIERWKRN